MISVFVDAWEREPRTGTEPSREVSRTSTQLRKRHEQPCASVNSDFFHFVTPLTWERENSLKQTPRSRTIFFPPTEKDRGKSEVGNFVLQSLYKWLKRTNIEHKSTESSSRKLVECGFFAPANFSRNVIHLTDRYVRIDKSEKEAPLARTRIFLYDCKWSL